MQVSGIMEKSQGVRKGTWSKFEDDLLKACVQNYGEGKWHLVPQRAGLNRCRKSCRLRWLNYLKPNIKRGDFSEDEVDLMIKLHKLLGNRCVWDLDLLLLLHGATTLFCCLLHRAKWSLIAGRLPGRTSNDVKNYWNTYMRSKKEKKIVKQEEAETVKSHEVIKPQPRTFSKSSSMWLQGKLTATDPSSSKVSMSNEGGADSNWWETLLHDKEEEDGVLMTTNPFDFLTEGQTWNDFLDQI